LITLINQSEAKTKGGRQLYPHKRPHSESNKLNKKERRGRRQQYRHDERPHSESNKLNKKERRGRRQQYRHDERTHFESNKVNKREKRGRRQQYPHNERTHFESNKVNKRERKERKQYHQHERRSKINKQKGMGRKPSQDHHDVKTKWMVRLSNKERLYGVYRCRCTTSNGRVQKRKYG